MVGKIAVTYDTEMGGDPFLGLLNEEDFHGDGRAPVCVCLCVCVSVCLSVCLIRVCVE
jgi:hypothetical protein